MLDWPAKMNTLTVSAAETVRILANKTASVRRLLCIFMGYKTHHTETRFIGHPFVKSQASMRFSQAR